MYIDYKENIKDILEKCHIKKEIIEKKESIFQLIDENNKKIISNQTKTHLVKHYKKFIENT